MQIMLMPYPFSSRRKSSKLTTGLPLAVVGNLLPTSLRSNIEAQFLPAIALQDNVFHNNLGEIRHLMTLLMFLRPRMNRQLTVRSINPLQEALIIEIRPI
jgi:hypothetical protein